jgi:integrase
VLGAFVAGTGLRISELLALEIGKHISANCTMISIIKQRGKKGTLEPPKTEAGGVRRVYVASPLASLLRSYIGNRKGGFLFEAETGNVLSPGNLWRDGFRMVVKEMGLNIRFHFLRRFRESTLQAGECRQLVYRISATS